MFILFTISIGTSIALASYSVIKYAAKLPMNGEIKMLEAIELTLKSQSKSANQCYAIHRKTWTKSKGKKHYNI